MQLTDRRFVVSLIAVCALVANATCRAGITGNVAGNGREQTNTESATTTTSIFGENGITRTVRHISGQCADSEDIFWCIKVQATKLLGRALKVSNIKLLEGVALVRKSINENNTTRTGRASPGISIPVAPTEIFTTNRDVEQLSMKSLDALLIDRLLSFTRSRQLQVNLPRLLAHGKSNSQSVMQSVIDYFVRFTGMTAGRATDQFFSFQSQQQPMNEYDEAMMMSREQGRKKKDDKKYLGPFIAAVMLKAAILKMAYHSIAILAGKALIVGKIALIISAIIGLKKLVSHDSGEKTTYEIVKHPQVQQSHTYSSSHSGEYESSGHESGSGGSYHRSIDDEMLMQDKAYQAWVPTKAA